MRDGQTRKAATGRLLWLINSKLLNAEDRRRCAEILWAPEQLEGALPGNTVFYPSAFLTLPRPEATDVESILAASLLTGEPLSDAIVSDGALAWAYATKQFKLDQPQLLAEITRLHVFIAGHEAAPSYPDPFGDNVADMIDHCGRMVASLARRALDCPPATDYIRALIALDKYPLRIEPAIPALIRLELLDLENGLTKVRALLAAEGDVESVVLAGILDQLRYPNIVSPELDAVLWKEFAQAVAARQPGSLARLLRFTAYILRRDPSRVPREIDSLLSIGLARILVETETTAPTPELSYDPFLVRYFAALLITAMNRENRGDPITRTAWAEAIEADPLPDTRRARELALRPLLASDDTVE